MRDETIAASANPSAFSRTAKTVWLVRIVMTLLALMTAVGVIMFDILPGAISGHTLTLLIAITGYAGGVLLLARRPQLGWRLALPGAGVHLGWGVLFKVILDQDAEQLFLGTAQIAALGLLLAPPTRRHVRQ